MTPNHLNERFRSFISEKFPLARKRGIEIQDNLLESGILDSLGILDLVSFIEQNFGVILKDEELIPENFQTIECMTAFVQNRIPPGAKQQ